LILGHKAKDREDDETGVKRRPGVATGEEGTVPEEVVVEFIVGAQS
jgi:hypothetical protein